MAEFSTTDSETGKIVTGVDAYRQAIDTILRTAPTDAAPGFQALETVDNRVRSRSGLDAADVTASAEEAILRDLPGIVVADIEPEMTVQLEVGAINIRFQIIDTGEIGEVRVEIPT